MDSWRSFEQPDGRWARLAAASIVVAWIVGLASVLSHRVFVTNDSVSNYAHVWHISRTIQEEHRLPYHFPALASGDALAYPYAFLPWTSAALFRPLLGDWVVTLWLVVGFAGLLGAMWWALPELRRPWGCAVVLANPVLVEAVLLGQMPFIWAVAFMFAAIGAWRRGLMGWSVALAVACNTTHPAVAAPILLGVVGIRLFWEPARRRLCLAYLLAGMLSLPAVFMVLRSPALTDSTPTVLALNFAGTTGWRAIVVAVPLAAVLLQRRSIARMRWVPLVFLILQPALVPLRHTTFAWGSLTRDEDVSLERYLESSDFQPDVTYRLLVAGDGKVGMYQLIKRGGVLDSEFFPESIRRQSWNGSYDYNQFLESRRVKAVIIFRSYDDRFRTNEHTLLDQFVLGEGWQVTHFAGFDLYRRVVSR